MEQKKETNAQLKSRIKKAVLHLDRTKDTKEIYFSDKGLRLIKGDDFVVIGTGYHRHVFNEYTTSGVSRPYLYTSRLIDIALENDCKTQDGYSFAKLVEILKGKEDPSEYHLVVYVEWWLFLIFNNLYSISEDEISSWIVYFKYLCALAVNHIILDEHKDGLTNKEFVNKFLGLISEFTHGDDERQLFAPLTDEERIQQEVAAIQEQELEESIKEGDNEG